MTERIELKDVDVENIVGGAFNFYTNSKGQPKCYIDDSGSYFCSPEAFAWTVARTAGSSDDSKTVLAEGIALGYFWQ